jgi:hypothetical protein
MKIIRRRVIKNQFYLEEEQSLIKTITMKKKLMMDLNKKT